MPTRIRRANPPDLDFLLELEQTVFLPDRRESRESLRRSISSPHQEVWLALDEKDGPLAGLCLRIHRKTLRLYSLGVLPSARGQGIGGMLLEWSETRARDLAVERLSLEADRADERLLQLYRAHGYTPRQVLPNYYGNGADGLRLEKRLPPSPQSL